MKKSLSIIISLALLIWIVYILKGKSPPSTSVANIPIQMQSTPLASSPNVTVKNGIQYINLDVKHGYSPETSVAKSGIPTKLIAKTNGTYDCSSSLSIRSVKYQAYLPATWETEIDLGTPQSGETINGVCGMGMYSFEVKYM